MSWSTRLVVLNVFLQVTWSSAEDAHGNAEVCTAGEEACAGRGKSMMQMSSSYAVARSHSFEKLNPSYRSFNCSSDDRDQCRNVSLEEIDQIKSSFIPQGNTFALQAKADVTSASTGTCFDGQDWLATFRTEPTWKNYSQGDQDAVLHSLFSSGYLGTTDKNFVEFGFPDHEFSTSYGNGRALMENMGFKSAFVMDGGGSNPSINKHKRIVTAKNIVELFDEFNAPLEMDYVSVDIDSCDLWVFYALTKKYRPRVVTVEYNSNYALGDFSTQRCADPMNGRDPTAPGAYYANFDNIYGASMSALELAGQTRGYCLVYVTPYLDVFLVRSDLMCNGTAVPVDTFKDATALPLWGEYDGSFGSKEEVTMQFSDWLKVHPLS